MYSNQYMINNVINLHEKLHFFIRNPCQYVNLIFSILYVIAIARKIFFNNILEKLSQLQITNMLCYYRKSTYIDMYYEVLISKWKKCILSMTIKKDQPPLISIFCHEIFGQWSKTADNIKYLPKIYLVTSVNLFLKQFCGSILTV